MTIKADIDLLLPAERIASADQEALSVLALKYPYCQALQFSYLNALKNSDERAYNKYLAKVALIAPRRELLSDYLFRPASFIRNERAPDIQPVEAAQEPSAPQTEVNELIETVIPELELPVVDALPAEEASPVAAEEPAEEPGVQGEPGPAQSEDQKFSEPEAERGALEPAGTGLADTEEPAPDAEILNSDTQDVPAEPVKLEDVAHIASKDYFVFNMSDVDPLKNEDLPQAKHMDKEKSELSPYDDETMPYTFLWWLHKTRKEYASTYQPFVRNPSYVEKSPVGELNQQIIENIFHIQPELNTFEAAAIASSVEFELKRKEDDLIDRFIKDEPQIRPPAASRLDNENKARKSAEDNFELVSETLAKIYTDQMLYQKAIEIYRKLSLKFPDKNHYFAGQIKELEKKIS